MSARSVYHYVAKLVGQGVDPRVHQPTVKRFSPARGWYDPGQECSTSEGGPGGL